MIYYNLYNKILIELSSSISKSIQRQINFQINWFKTRNNAPNADKFILDNYFLYKDLSPWIVFKKNNFTN